jgi:CheY-like chemotaxis protein
MALDPKIRINLDRSVVLLVEQNSQAMDALTAMFRGFGVRKQFKATTGAEAMHFVKTQELDLIVSDASMPDMDGYDFVRWLRREAPEASRFTPVIMLTGHAARSMVEKSRDSGANFVVSRPFTPELLLQRVFWVAKDERQMVVAEGYVGPDRRFKNMGPPLGVKGRRKDDLSTHVGAAKDPNMDQSDIDMLLKPMKAQL